MTLTQYNYVTYKIGETTLLVPEGYLLSVFGLSNFKWVLLVHEV